MVSLAAWFAAISPGYALEPDRAEFQRQVARTRYRNADDLCKVARTPCHNQRSHPRQAIGFHAADAASKVEYPRASVETGP